MFLPFIMYFSTGWPLTELLSCQKRIPVRGPPKIPTYLLTFERGNIAGFFTGDLQVVAYLVLCINTFLENLYQQIAESLRLSHL
jgi:hypothetical protein